MALRLYQAPVRSQCSLPSEAARCRSRTRAISRRTSGSCTRSARLALLPRRSAPPRSARLSAFADRSATPGRSSRRRARTWSSSPAASAFRRFALLYGARTPTDLVFLDEVKSWQCNYDVDLDITVDVGDTDWKGKVGLVTKLIPPAQFLSLIHI